MSDIIKYKGITINNFTKLGYIYSICEEVNEELVIFYIGITIKHYTERIDEHLKALREGTHYNHKLQILYNTNDYTKFKVMIIDTVIASNLKDLSILLRYKEKEAIKRYKPACNIMHNKSKIKSKDITIKNIIILKKAEEA